MKLLWLYLLAFMLFPIIGEVRIWYGGLNIAAGGVTLALIINHTLYVFIEVIIAYVIQRCNPRKEVLSCNFDLPFALRTIKRSIMMIALVLIVFYLFSGHMIVHGTVGRGEIRASAMEGLYGIIYNWITLYLPSGVLILNSIIYRKSNHKVQKELKSKLLLLYSLTVFIGVLTGYKATFLIIIMGGVAVLTHKRVSLRRLLIFLLLMAAGLVVTTMFAQRLDMISAIHFLIYRMTTMSAYGAVAVWNIFPEGASFDNIILYGLSVLGNRLASVVSGYSVTSVDFLPINPSRLVTYIAYPNPIGAVMGSVNVTLTNFGEAVYVFGRKLFFAHAIIAGLILGASIRAFKRSLIQNNVMKGMLWGVYFFIIVIPWVNGGNTLNLICVPTIVWLLITYIVIGMIAGPLPVCSQQSLRACDGERKRCGKTS